MFRYKLAPVINTTSGSKNRCLYWGVNFEGFLVIGTKKPGVYIRLVFIPGVDCSKNSIFGHLGNEFVVWAAEK
jgi:hypothetical protein